MSWVYLLRSFVEILLLTLALYLLIQQIWHNRIKELLVGLIWCPVAYIVSQLLGFNVIQVIMEHALHWSALGFVILFQPEIRLALARLSSPLPSNHELSQFDQFVESLAQCVYRFSEKKLGALIAIEQHDNLDEYVNGAIKIGALFTPELLESIFITKSPLHDGAVILRGRHILSAATILPLADDVSQFSKSMGTRHRAALGLSQRTDALTIVVSEDSGRVSIAIDGIMTRGIKIERLRSILHGIFTHPRAKSGTLVWFKG